MRSIYWYHGYKGAEFLKRLLCNRDFKRPFGQQNFNYQLCYQLTSPFFPTLSLNENESQAWVASSGRSFYYCTAFAHFHFTIDERRVHQPGTTLLVHQAGRSLRAHSVHLPFLRNLAFTVTPPGGDLPGHVKDKLFVSNPDGAQHL